MKKYLVVGGLVFLSACVGNPGISSKVDAVEVALTTAENTYVNTCRAAPLLRICVDPTKQIIKDLDMKAYNAVKAAQQNEALLSFAIDAVTSLTNATTSK